MVHLFGPPCMYNNIAFYPIGRTTRECVHLVTRVHFRSRYKDDAYTIRSAVPENPMLHANIMALCLIERDYGSYRRSKFYIAGIGIFDLLDHVTLTFIYELDPIVIPHLQRGFRKLSSDRQTYRHDQNYILVPRRFAGGQLFTCSLHYPL